MTKLALIGGPEIVKYTVADVMWAYISEVSGVDFNFDIIPIATEHGTRTFYEQYVDDQSFIGFNVALPWKQQFATYINESSPGGGHSIINTVYKSQNEFCGINTDPLGIVRGLGGYDLLGKNVLILGAGGGGQATASHMVRELGAKVYIYDVVDRRSDALEGKWLRGLNELRERKYDVIINASPLGKFYLDRPIDMFVSPIDIVMLKEITHPDTILQEMNYLPLETLFLQIGKALGLRTISGELMLVFQAVESFSRYFGKNLSLDQVEVVIKKMQKHILGQESAILERSCNSNK